MDKMCFSGTSFRERAYFFVPGFRDKVFFSLAHALDLGCVSLMALGLESGYSGIGRFSAPVGHFTLQIV